MLRLLWLQLWLGHTLPLPCCLCTAVIALAELYHLYLSNPRPAADAQDLLERDEFTWRDHGELAAVDGQVPSAFHVDPEPHPSDDRLPFNLPGPRHGSVLPHPDGHAPPKQPLQSADSMPQPNNEMLGQLPSGKLRPRDGSVTIRHRLDAMNAEDIRHESVLSLVARPSPFCCACRVTFSRCGCGCILAAVLDCGLGRGPRDVAAATGRRRCALQHWLWTKARWAASCARPGSTPLPPMCTTTTAPRCTVLALCGSMRTRCETAG